ncbi:MAG: hypothetical protein HQ559_02940 [Lentisphaerae bacterium]|nr:hypothetical protein [Lentisphaerota bacterium]
MTDAESESDGVCELDWDKLKEKKGADLDAWCRRQKESRGKDYRAKVLRMIVTGKLPPDVLSHKHPQHSHLLTTLDRLITYGAIRGNVTRHPFRPTLITDVTGIELEARGFDYLQELNRRSVWRRILVEAVRAIVTVLLAFAVFLLKEQWTKSRAAPKALPPTTQKPAE